jgi:NADH-quinone oxidoreductase subunit M
MLLILLILIPLLTGLLSFAWKNNSVKGWALLSTLASVFVALVAFVAQKGGILVFDAPWIPSLGARFSLDAGGMATVLALLTAIVYLVIFIAQWNKPLENLNRFFGLMFVYQSGIT